VDPEFQRALILVLFGGLAVTGAGAAGLFVVFRRFGRKDAGSRTHIGIIAALVLFVLACCAALFALSYAGR
jgi:hypothetical protein